MKTPRYHVGDFVFAWSRLGYVCEVLTVPRRYANEKYHYRVKLPGYGGDTTMYCLVPKENLARALWTFTGVQRCP